VAGEAARADRLIKIPTMEIADGVLTVGAGYATGFSGGLLRA
jgi:hypothetical protein